MSAMMDRPADRFPPDASGSINTPGQVESYGRGAGGNFETAEGRAGQLSFLLEITRSLVGAVDVEPVLAPLLSRLAERENLSFASIIRVDKESEPDRRSLSDIHTGAEAEAVPLRDSALLRWVIQQQQEVYVPRVEVDPRVQGWESCGVRSAYLVPLQADAGLLGVLAMELITRTASGPALAI